MSRPIRFRAWDKTDNVMHDYLPEILFGQRAVAVPVMDADGGHMEKRLFEDIVLMQFTGLTDKNGKEIYEGDILKGSMYIRNKWVEPSTLKVEYYVSDATTVAGFRFENQKGTWDYPALLSDMEVIGNVWEHPHLLQS